jgi:hypothetical protein
MTQRYAAHLSVLVGLIAALRARPVRVDDRPCSPMAVEADARVRARRPSVRERIREAFDARDGVDACARIRLTAGDGGIALEVVLPDGRSAARTVSHTEAESVGLGAQSFLDIGGWPAGFAGRARSVVRTLVGVDGEVSRPPDPNPAADARLPVRTLGLALGVTVGTP